MTERHDEELSTADMAAKSTVQETDRSRPEADDERVAGVPDSKQGSDRPTPLFASEAAEGYRSRWQGVQADFVDDPRHAVEQADALVAGLMKDLAQTFADERTGLEQQWDRGDDVSTEDLRVALQRYRSFFDRLLSL